jgi:hypothetical protein
MNVEQPKEPIEIGPDNPSVRLEVISSSLDIGVWDIDVTENGLRWKPSGDRTWREWTWSELEQFDLAAFTQDFHFSVEYAAALETRIEDLTKRLNKLKAEASQEITALAARSKMRARINLAKEGKPK